jgi:hypothetical protein
MSVHAFAERDFVGWRSVDALAGPFDSFRSRLRVLGGKARKLLRDFVLGRAVITKNAFSMRQDFGDLRVESCLESLARIHALAAPERTVMRSLAR